jgi:hypothetical protein
MFEWKINEKTYRGETHCNYTSSILHPRRKKGNAKPTRIKRLVSKVLTSEALIEVGRTWRHYMASSSFGHQSLILNRYPLQYVDADGHEHDAVAVIAVSWFMTMIGASQLTFKPRS